MTTMDVTLSDGPDVAPREGRVRSALGRIARRMGGREAATGMLILGILILVALFAPWLAPHDPEAIEPGRVLAAPDLAHPFGSDTLGRDVFSRVLFAYRVSLVVSVGSVLAALLIGIPLGLLAGYRGGWVDTVLMRPLDLLLALPAMLLAVSLIAILGPGAVVALIAIAIIYLPILARVIRGSVLVVRTEAYVEGAKARGVGGLGIMRRHVLPNSLGPAIVQASILMGFALQIEAALSFLGLGTQPPTPSLGVMLAEGRDVLAQAWWVEVFPGLAIVLAVLAFILIGDGLRARFDPRRLAE
ncbi:MAG TPA: ABC transporter permease [Candidatus Limnocylindrales bacterium]|jgi:peptide/nickel transport system permease protein